MAGSRGAANGALYRARVLLDCWDAARDAARFSEEALSDAFLPAVRQHLCDAYGWFLLSVTGQEAIDGDLRPPASTADLPAPEPGKARAPELREFALLEREGWIGDLLAPLPTAVMPRRAPPMLGSDRRAPGFAVLEDWWQRLQNIMQRMDDSLSEC